MCVHDFISCWIDGPIDTNDAVSELIALQEHFVFDLEDVRLVAMILHGKAEHLSGNAWILVPLKIEGGNYFVVLMVEFPKTRLNFHTVLERL